MVSKQMLAVRPDFRAYSLLGLTLEFLQENDIKYLILDVDNCLLPARAKQIDEKTIAHFRTLSRAGIVIYLVSNTYEMKRVAHLTEQLGIGWKFVIPGWRWWRWKPNPWCMLHAMERGNMNPEQTLVVGDRLTDVKAGKRAGCRTLLVLPVGEYPWYTKIKIWRSLKLIEYLSSMPNVMPKWIDHPPVIATEESDIVVPPSAERRQKEVV